MNNVTQQPKYLTLSVLTLALFSSLSAQAAPVAPDAGQTSRELQKQPELNAPKATAPVRVEGEAVAESASDNRVRIVIKTIHISGNTTFAPSELEALVADLINGEHSLADLDAGAARITAYYRERGYVVARAYLPMQDIKDGAVEVRVLEGQVGARRLTNQSRLSDAQANGYLSDIKPGDALQAQPVDRALLLLSDTPGVGGARATLQPGASVGTSDLLVELDPAAPYAANVEADNYGNRYTGEYRLGATLALNSPLKIGDQLTVRALTSNEALIYARLAYQLPVGSGGLKVGGAYSDTNYTLGKEFASLQAHGTARSASLYATYPFIRSQNSNLYGTLTWEQKKLVDRTDAPVSLSDKQVSLYNLGLAGNHRDALGGAGYTSFDAALISGRLNMDAVSLATDATTAKSDGNFARLTYNLNRLQRITDADSLSLVVSGQQASKNLNSSEKFSLGGASGVRAYPQGEGNGDEGWLANLELRHSFMGNLQAVAFYDAGAVNINHTAYSAAANTRNIAGVGVGLNAQYKSLQFKTALAWSTHGGQAQAEPASSNPRLWVQVGGTF
ncbi:MAG: ShlB/FhaC/HecB family hemolysin secretion/activation protein [Gallionella sp.]|nr:ShlB/FhaC/HecB family hemolysin secretion/activation protein [Gallionella sp.]